MNELVRHFYVYERSRSNRYIYVDFMRHCREWIFCGKGGTIGKGSRVHRSIKEDIHDGTEFEKFFFRINCNIILILIILCLRGVLGFRQRGSVEIKFHGWCMGNG